MPLNQKPRRWEAGLWVEGLVRFRSLRWAGPQMPQVRAGAQALCTPPGAWLKVK